MRARRRSRASGPSTGRRRRWPGRGVRRGSGAAPSRMEPAEVDPRPRERRRRGRIPRVRRSRHDEVLEVLADRAVDRRRVDLAVRAHRQRAERRAQRDRDGRLEARRRRRRAREDVRPQQRRRSAARFRRGSVADPPVRSTASQFLSPPNDEHRRRARSRLRSVERNMSTRSCPEALVVEDARASRRRATGSLRKIPGSSTPGNVQSARRRSCTPSRPGGSSR